MHVDKDDFVIVIGDFDASEGTQDIASVTTAVCITIAPHHVTLFFRPHWQQGTSSAETVDARLFQVVAAAVVAFLRCILLSCLFSFFLCNISVCPVKFDFLRVIAALLSSSLASTI